MVRAPRPLSRAEEVAIVTALVLLCAFALAWPVCQPSAVFP